MTTIITGATVSLDGYIAGENESGFDLLFQWYEAGEVEVPTVNSEMTFQLTPQSAEHVAQIRDSTGCLVVGRHLFEVTSGWGGRHPLGMPYVVLTHSVPDGWERESEWYTFVTDGGIEAAIETAKRIAGEKNVAVNGGQMASQALAAGLLDEVWLDLAPVILGAGTPFLTSDTQLALDGPLSVVESERVTHLRYRVRR
jgi:dihydrofolate reductase